ncbi:MAG: hypothetical protein EOO50_03300 [Flavobacterium sp.]|uniref:lipocalin family protein n=1 Tax=Flavobacterium sp. TaxID=239 RepID=UPI001211B20B|nr:lipocalin family protein [Flavobacterium sp.]RZJ68126.1 MAG: hypothetical protein EOO50_03300 [Flavobacterium sp.]
MKKLSLLAFAGALLFLASCEDDDKPNYVSPNYLAGQWKLTQVGELTSVPDGAIVDYTDVAGTCDEGDDITFGEALNSTFTGNDYTTNGTECDLVTTSGTYSLNGRDVTLTSGEDTTTLGVITLTFEVLEFSYTDAESGELVFHKYTKQ